MSLHLGNLSPRVRKDELEHVFRQFGRCSVLLKDGYGFAKYDFEGDAEVALRALKGRKIRGQTLDLSWSDQQPKPLHRFARADKSRGMMQHGRGHNFSESRGKRQKFTGLHEDRARFNRNTGNHNLGNGNGKDIDKPVGFDRYQPDCCDERFVEYDGNHGVGQRPGSPSGRMLSDKYKRIHHLEDTSGSQTCFKCGAVGHKVRDCPSEGDLHGMKSYNWDHRHENRPKLRARNEVGGPESRYPNSDIQHEYPQVENNRKQQREREDVTNGLSDRKVRKLGSSHPDSDHTSPMLSTHSRSQEPLSMAVSQSVSRSPLPHSLSVSSRSKANSHNSRSRPRSHSRSSSFSVSLGRSARSLSGSPIPRSKEVLTEINKLFEPDDGENSPMENGTEVLSENQEPELDLVDYDPISPDRPDTNLNELLEDDEIPQSNEIILDKNGDGVATAAELSVEKQRVTGELKNEAEKTISTELVKISDPNAPSCSGIGSRLSISADEVNRVSKHYGLKQPDHDDHINTVEDYFGCARLWPWEMIYYRRHKKGLVSTDNHAQRVAQNTSFGIVDKYIRSSSGWFERNDQLP